MTLDTVAVSDATRKDVWELLVNLERNVRYYGLIGDRHHLNYRLIRFGVLAGILLEGLILFLAAGGEQGWWYAGGVVAFVLALLTAFDVVTGFGESATGLKFTSAVCDDLRSEVEQLWTQIESSRVTETQASERHGTVVERWGRATQKITLSLHNLENEETTKIAVQVLQNKYGR